jgi:PilZ domain
VGEQRSAVRTRIALEVRVANAAEQLLPRARSIDCSTVGLLLAFAEPVGLVEGSRVVLSLRLRDGHLHTLAIVRRVARGADFRTYVAFAFDGLGVEDARRLERELRVCRKHRSSTRSRAGRART